MFSFSISMQRLRPLLSNVLIDSLLCVGRQGSFILITALLLYRRNLRHLFERGIASSTSSVYHPSGNGQAKKTVGTVWKAIQLALKSLDLPPSHWEVVLEDVLHSMRSLLCTATNTTPHERFFSYLTSLVFWRVPPVLVDARKKSIPTTFCPD